MKRWMSVAVVVAASVVATSVGPSAAVPGTLGPRQTLEATAAAFTPGLAVLPSGAAVVTWANPGGTAVNVRVRQPGSNNWGGTITYTLTAPFTVDAVFGRTPVSVTTLGPSHFVMWWVEVNGGVARARVAKVSASSPSIFPITLETNAEGLGDLSVSSNAAGRAVAAWGLRIPGKVHFSVLPSPQGTWSAANDLAAAEIYFPSPAVADNGSFCVLYSRRIDAAPTIDAQTRCHSPQAPAGGASWASGLRAQQFAGRVSSTVQNWASISAAGNSFIVAVSSKGVGVANIAGSALDAVRVVVRSKASATSGSWTVEGNFSQANQLQVSPRLVAQSDGRAVLAFIRLEGTAGSTGAESSGSVATFVANRSSSGEWGRPSIMLAATVPSSGFVLALALGMPALGPGGAVSVTGIQTELGIGLSGISFTNSYRASWNAFASPSSTWLLPALLGSSAFSGASRLTVVANATVGGSGEIVARTSAMPRPLALRAATLNSVPTRGAVVRCNSTWSEAAEVTVRWLRNGQIIAGANDVTYTPRAVDVGRRLSCRAVGTNPAGVTGSTSNARTVSS